MKKILLSVLFLPPAAALAAPFSLQEAERRVRENSPRLRAARQDAAAALEQARATGASLLPRLTLEGSFRYVSEVPELALGPVPQRLGDNENFSIGPALSYTLWDTGAGRAQRRGLYRLSEAKEKEAEASERQALLSTRVAYHQAQLSRKELELSEKTLSVASAQSRDIDARYRSGVVARLDALNARMEVSNYELRVTQARAEAQVAMAELASWVGEIPADAELDPLDAAAAGRVPEEAPLTHPQVEAQWKAAESFREGLRAQWAGYGPTIQLQAKTSLDYPNGPRLERIGQNTVSLGMSWPIFEWGKTPALVAQKRAEEESARRRAEQGALDLRRDWAKARARHDNLVEQSRTSDKLLREARDLARLNYDTYKAGRISFLEVQSSNLRLLDAEIRKARIEAQLLSQKQTLKFLAGEEVVP
jgi:outer membrane protein TolC